MRNSAFDVAAIAIGDTAAIVGAMFPQADAHVLAWRQAKWLREHTAEHDARNGAVNLYLLQQRQQFQGRHNR